MGGTLLFVVTSFLLAGSLRGQETNYTSGCLLDNMYSLSCTSAGITNLQDVGQDSKKLPSWPQSPRLLKTMKQINLSNNMISSLHLNVFYKFLSLEGLNVSSNYISMVSINTNDEQEGKDTVFASLQTLVIDRNRLTIVPKGLGKLASLQTLHLSANSIERIQRDDFANCTQLQNLDLGHNRIHEIDPDAFRDLRNLQVLRLSNNALVSITPLVFLYSHILRADIDLSHNRWACDCRILPLKHLLTSLPLGIKKAWNVTCSLPLSSKGKNLLSIDYIDGSCQPTVDKYIYARKIVVKKRENTYLPCEIKDKTGRLKAFWWTPQGIISGEPSVTNHYIGRMSHEGLYICIADIGRIVYQIHFQTDAGKTLIRRPRDVQLLNSRMRTETDLALAVSLSVVISFICAFLLGVFLRPCLERLWRKLCKSKESKKKTSAETYDNEGFSEENVSRRHSSNGSGCSLSVHVSKDNSTGNDRPFDEPDSVKYENITYNEREIYYKDDQCNIDTQVPTRSELQERKNNVNEFVEAKNKDMHITGNSHSTSSKRVTWASNEESSPKVNIKHVISLLKPINIIVPKMENTNNHDQNGYSDVVIPKRYRDKDDQLSDENIVNYVSIQVGSESNEHVIPQVNLKHVMSLLKPINFIVPGSRKPEMAKTHYKDLANNSSQFKGINQNLYDSSLSDDGSSSSVVEEDDSSEEDYIINTRLNNENDSTKVNIKHVMSLVKPINIIVPECTACEIVKSPTQKQMFPTFLPRYPEYRMQNNLTQDIRLSGAPENQPIKDTIGKKAFYDSSSSDDEANDYSKSFIRPQNNMEVKQTLYDSSSSEDRSADEGSIINSVLITTKQETWGTKENYSPTVDLKHLMTLVKPINIIIPEPIMSDPVKRTSQKLFYPSNILSIYPDNRMKEKDNPHYQDNIQSEGTEKESYCKTQHDSKESKEILYDSSSSDEGSRDFDYYDDSSDKAVSIKSGWLGVKRPSWKTNIDTNPTANLQQVISLLKPINIIAPNSLEKNLSPFYPCGALRLPGDRMEERDNPENLYQDVKQLSSRPTRYIDGKQTFSNSSSSDDGSFDLDYKDDSSDEEVKINLGLLPTKQAPWTSNIDTSPTVNLQQVISLLKPINVIAPKFEHRMEDRDGLLKQSQETENQSPHPKYESSFVSSTRPIHYMEDKQIYSDSSSSDEESKESEEDHSLDERSIIHSDLLTKQATWARQQNVSPTVNLKHVMSLVKPINITIPESTVIDLVKRPSQTQFFSGSISRYPENRIEDAGNLQYYQDMKLSGEPEKKPYNKSQIYDKPPTLPINNGEGKKTFSDSSSSDDGSFDLDYKDDSADEEVKINLGLLPTKQAPWTSNIDTSPTVNLQQVISLLKPINVIAPKIDFRLKEKDTLLKQSQEPGYQSPHPKYESSFVSSTRPIYYMEDKQIYSDSSSSDEESKEDAEDHSSDERRIIDSDLLTKQATWERHQNVSPTVNLKHVMSLVKPINITIPESTVIDLVKRPSQTQFFPGSISRYPENRIEDAGNLQYYQDMKLSGEPEKKPYNKNQIYDKPPALPINKGEGKKTFSDSSSSDDGSFDLDYKDDSADEEVKINLGLLPTKQAPWTSNIDTSPRVNLQQVISLLKPINIIAPKFEHRMEDRDTLLKQSQETENQSPHPKHESSFVSSSRPIHYMEDKQIYSDSSSSDEESKESEEDHSSDERSIIHSDLLTKQATWARHQNVSPTVNLKHVMSLVKPINITIPESTVIDLAKRPSQTQFFPGSISRYPENRIEDAGNLQYYQDMKLSGEPEKKPYNKNQIYNKPPALPINNGDEKKTFIDSSSSDDSKEDSSDEWVTVNSGLLLTKQPSCMREGNQSPKVNLQQVISLLKPITIVAPNYLVTEPVGGPSQKQQTGITNYEAGNSKSSPTLRSDSKGKQTFYDSSSAEDESKDDEDHSSGNSIKNSDLLIAKQVTWTPKENVSPIVNFKHAMSLVRPIKIIVPENTASEKLQSPSLFPNGIPRNPEYKFEDIQLSSRPEHQSHSTNIDTNKTLCNPTGYKESLPRFYDSSSSKDESKKDHSSDVGGLMSSYLPTTKPATWTSKEVISPTVNLKQVISLVKPINIVSSDSMTDLKLHSPYDHQYGGVKNKSQDTNIEKGYLEILPRPTRHGVYNQILYDSSSSDDGSNKEDKGSGMNSDLLIIKKDTWESTESVSPKVNLKSVMSMVKPIIIKAPDSTVTEVLRRFKQNYVTNLPEHQTVSQSHNTTFKEHSVEKLNTPKTIRNSARISIDSSSSDHELNHLVYEIGQDSDAIVNTNLLAWDYNENSNPKVNLKQVISLLKPINIIAPDSTSTVKSSEQKYIFNMYQPEDRIKNVDTHNDHYDQDNKFHRGNSRKWLHNTSFKFLNSSKNNSEVTNTFHNRSPEDESSQINSYKNYDHLTPKHTTPASSDNTNPKLNLKHVISLLKPIRIAVPDITVTDSVKRRTKVLVAERLSHNTISEYYTDIINDSSSDGGSLFSFSQSNSLSDDSEKIDIAKDEVIGLMDIWSSNNKGEMDRGKISIQPGDNSNVSYHNPNTARMDEGLKEFAGGGSEPNKAKDVLHWLNTTTHDKENIEFPTNKSLSTPTSEQELVLDLNEEEWTTRTIVRKETGTMPTYESQTVENKTYLIPDIGETSTDANLLDFNSNDLSHELEGSPTVDYGRYFTKRRKAFDAFSEYLKD